MSWYINRMPLFSKDQGGIVISGILSYSVTFFIGVRVVTNKTSDCVEFKILGLGRRLVISSFKYYARISLIVSKT